MGSTLAELHPQGHLEADVVLREISRNEVEIVEALAQANGLDLDFVRSKTQGVSVEPYGTDGSLRIKYFQAEKCAKAIQLDQMATVRHSPLAKTYVVLWVADDLKTPCEIECFRIDGSDPDQLPSRSTLSFCSYADEFMNTNVPSSNADQ